MPTLAVAVTVPLRMIWEPMYRPGPMLVWIFPLASKTFHPADSSYASVKPIPSAIENSVTVFGVASRCFTVTGIAVALLLKIVTAWMSIGRGAGKNRAQDAARAALASPLLDVTIEGSKGVLFNIVGGNDLSLFEVNEAAEVIKQAVDPDANIIFGVASDSAMGSEVRITLIATGFVNKTEGDTREDDEFNKKLKNIKTEDELDVPSFLRRWNKPSVNNRQAVPQDKVARPQMRSYNNQ